MRLLGRSVAFVLLLAVAVIAAALLGTTYDAQRRSWSRDSYPAMRRTAAWQRSRLYEPRIEAALQLMGTVEPERLAFVRQRGIPIRFYSDGQMQKAECTRGDLGCTSVTRSEVYLSPDPRFRTGELAVILAHELLHCQRHDPVRGAYRRPLMSRLLLGDEESDAHRANLRAARLLHLSIRHDVLSLWPDYLLWFWPLGTMALCALAMHLACTGMVRVLLGVSAKQFRRLQRERWLRTRNKLLRKRGETWATQQ